MRNAFLLFAIVLILSHSSVAQAPQVSSSTAVTAVKSTTDEAVALANAALAAHGGDKLKKMGSIVVRGSVNMNVFGQSLPGAFSLAIAGPKYAFALNATVQSFTQIFDGERTYSSTREYSLPPMTSLGLPLLQRIGDPGIVVSPLDAGKGKKTGFRITTSEGFYTDFQLDEKTKQINSYSSAFDINGRTVLTAVEIDKCRLVDGVLVPEKYSQRFDLGQITAYVAFKAKDILINSTLDEDVFAFPKN